MRRSFAARFRQEMPMLNQLTGWPQGEIRASMAAAYGEIVKPQHREAPDRR